MNRSNDRRSMYHFDVNATTSCNLRCTYCIEHDWFKKKTNTPDENLIRNIKEKTKHMLSSDKFLSKFNSVGIYFWGGEPTLNPELIEELLLEFKDNKFVQFFIYSNGYNIAPVFDLLVKFKDEKIFNGEPKILIQISYDGIASHDTARVNVAGKGTALKVKENLYKVIDAGIPFVIKPTIAYDDLDKISANYSEFRRINDYIVSKNGNFRGLVTYTPTIDYLSDHDFTDEQIKNYNLILKEELKKIAKDEISFYKKHKQFFFSWLNPSKAICGAGGGLSVIDLNGDVLVCHGALYEKDRDDHKITNINLSNEEFVSDIVDASTRYDLNKGILSDECKTCFTHYCMKCNVKKHSVSKKEEYFDKWNDFNDQPHLCELFKFLGVFRMSLMRVIEKG